MHKLRLQPALSLVASTSRTSPKEAPILSPTPLFKQIRGISWIWTQNGEWEKTSCAGGVRPSNSWRTRRCRPNSHGHPNRTLSLLRTSENSKIQRWSCTSLNTTDPRGFHSRSNNERKASWLIFFSNPIQPIRLLAIFALPSVNSPSWIWIPSFSPSERESRPHKTSMSCAISYTGIVPLAKHNPPHSKTKGDIHS